MGIISRIKYFFVGERDPEKEYAEGTLKDRNRKSVHLKGGTPRPDRDPETGRYIGDVKKGNGKVLKKQKAA